MAKELSGYLEAESNHFYGLSRVQEWVLWALCGSIILERGRPSRAGTLLRDSLVLAELALRIIARYGRWADYRTRQGD